MTFLEAAIEVLRENPGPLHFSDIARQAVERKLLSHVGRDPEAAMKNCLTTAVKGNANPILTRAKPGHYMVRPGATLPDPPAAPPTASPLSEEADGESERPKRKTRTRKKASRATSARSASRSTRKSAKDSESQSDEAAKESKGSSKEESDSTQVETEMETASDGSSEREEGDTPRRGSRRGERTTRRTRGRRRSSAAEADESEETAQNTDDQSSSTANLAFEAPSGSGLEGVTDVALVMANAMSRLADERPELRDELEAMQSNEGDEAESSEDAPARTSRGDARRNFRDDAPRGRRSRSSARGGGESRTSSGPDGQDSSYSERSSRRRRRRKRRSRKPEWSAGSGQVTSGRQQDQGFLDQIVAVLEEAGSRSLHVRQIAEGLAAQGVLEGEISEIERAVTAAILRDVRALGRLSRFSIRGEARYQLHGGRLPAAAAEAEREMHKAVARLRQESASHLLAWLQSLGARGLESLMRIYLDVEGFDVIQSLAPNRGLARLIVEERDTGERILVWMAPARATVEGRAWSNEVSRHRCQSVLLVHISESSAAEPLDEADSARVIQAAELVDWMLERELGVTQVKFSVPVLDADVIESLSGLDT